MKSLTEVNIFDAVIQKNYIFLKILLVNGADINIRLNPLRIPNMTPLIYFTSNKNKELVKLCIEFGADVTQREYVTKRTALEMAKYLKYGKEFIKLLS